MSNTINFWNAFEAQTLGQALAIFSQLNTAEQLLIFTELFQKSRYQKMPNALSVLFRELHEDKKFEDFYAAWHPPKDKLNPVEKYGQKFEQFFPAPTRVLNAINWDNPREIISIGLHWLNATQLEQMLTAVNDSANKSRGDKIKDFAEKVKTGIYTVKSDDNLGTPF